MTDLLLHSILVTLMLMSNTAAKPNAKFSKDSDCNYILYCVAASDSNLRDIMLPLYTVTSAKKDEKGMAAFKVGQSKGDCSKVAKNCDFAPYELRDAAYDMMFAHSVKRHKRHTLRRRPLQPLARNAFTLPQKPLKGLSQWLDRRRQSSGASRFPPVIRPKENRLVNSK